MSPGHPPPGAARPSSGLKAAALALKLALELCALAALAYWGARTGPLLASIALGIGAPLVAAVIWARWAAPQSSHRLHGAGRVAVELAVFAAAAVALVLAGADTLAGILIVLAVTDAWRLHRWRL